MAGDWWSTLPAQRGALAVKITEHLDARLVRAGGDPAAWRSALLDTAARLGFVGLALWVPGEDGRLRNALFASTVDMTVFAEQTRTLSFGEGEGMPGRTWLHAAPEWIPNVIHDDNFPRLRGAIRDLVRAVVAVPVISGERPVAVLEFFSRQVLEPDPETTEVLRQLGVIAGRYYPRLTDHETA